MTCQVCGIEKPEEARCPQCGHPEVPEAAAKLLAEARSLVAAGELDRSIRTAPDAALPHLRLAQGYERKLLGGEMALQALVEREFREALRLSPRDREVHIARLGFWVRTGRLPFLKAEYERRKEELPFAEECLKILDVLGRSVAIADSVDAVTGAATMRARYFFISAAGLGTVGLVELGVVITRILNDEQYAMMAHMDFFICAGCLTAAGILILEALRARKKGRAA